MRRQRDDESEPTPAWNAWIEQQYHFEDRKGPCMVVRDDIPIPSIAETPAIDWDAEYELVVWPANDPIAAAGREILRLAAENARLREGARLVLAAFDSGVFVRDISGDDTAGWSMKMVEPLRGLGLLAEVVGQK